MVAECTRLENLMPSYEKIMRKLGCVIRNKVWQKSDEKRLAYILYCCNNILAVLTDAIGENVEIAEFYVKLLIKYWNRYSFVIYDNEFEIVYQMIHSVIADEITKDQWDRINPYYETDYSDADVYGKRFTEILADFISNVDPIAAREFFVEEGKLSRLVRARRDIHSSGDDIVPPSIEIAKKYNIINRWNPPEKRYSYLVVETANISPDEVCLEEIRSQAGEDISLVDFKVREISKKKKLLNLAYEGVDDFVIESEVTESLNAIVQEDIEKIVNDSQSGNKDIHNLINDAVKENKEKTKTLANLYVGRKLLSTICRVIFIPLDKDEDNSPDLKDRCYKSFHVLAQFLEDNGFAGVVFPSTRMMLRGERGVNVVLFDPEDVEPIHTTLRYVTR
jgi:hypothetical protein